MGKFTGWVPKQRIDYTDLLRELQGETSPAVEEETLPAKQQPFSLFRQRIMSNEQICYLYSTRGGPLHDKSCPAARNIPDECLGYSHEYLTQREQCPLCAIQAYVRSGATDFYQFSLYEKIFSRLGLTPVHIRRIYIQEKMQTFANSVNCSLTIRCREDSWRLEADPAGLRLLHNNYRVFPDGTRVFTRGYHVQAEGITANYALSVIAGYTYEAHKAAVLRNLQQEQILRERLERLPVSASPEVPREELPLPAPQRREGLWRRFRAWLRSVFKKRRSD